MSSYLIISLVGAIAGVVGATAGVLTLLHTIRSNKDIGPGQDS